MGAVGRGVVAAATVAVTTDVGVVIVAGGALDVVAARGVTVLEVAGVVDGGAVGGEEEVEFAADVAPVRVGGFVPAALVELSVLHAATLIRPMARTATPTLRRS